MSKQMPAQLPKNYFSIPGDAQFEIFKHLSPTDLDALKKTSKAASDLVQAYQNHQENIFTAKSAALHDWLQS